MGWDGPGAWSWSPDADSRKREDQHLSQTQEPQSSVLHKGARGRVSQCQQRSAGLCTDGLRFRKKATYLLAGLCEVSQQVHHEVLGLVLLNWPRYFAYNHHEKSHSRGERGAQVSLHLRLRTTNATKIC